MTLRKCGAILVASLVTSLLLPGCGSGDEAYRKQVSKVTGKLTVDGKEPGEGILVQCTALSEEDNDPTHTSMSETMSNPDGTFEISTYEKGDGVPNGEYALTVVWGQLNLMTRSYGGPDKLKGAYSDPKNAKFSFIVEGGPVDLGVLELTIPEDTKPEPASKTPDVQLGGNDEKK